MADEIFERITLINTLRNFGLTVALLVSSLYGLKTYLKTEVFFSVLYGAILTVNPKCLISYEILGNNNDIYQFLCSFLGALLIYNAMFLFMILLKPNGDLSFTLNGHLWVKIISLSLILTSVLMFYKYGAKHSEIASDIIWSYGLPVFISLFVNIIYLSNNGPCPNLYGARTIRIVNIDFFLTLIIGLVLFGFPVESLLELNVRKVYNVDELICRCCGVLIVSIALESSVTLLSLQSNRHRRNLDWFLIKLLGNILMFQVLTLGHSYYHVKWPISYSMFFVAYNFVIAVAYSFYF